MAILKFPKKKQEAAPAPKKPLKAKQTEEEVEDTEEEDTEEEEAEATEEEDTEEEEEGTEEETEEEESEEEESDEEEEAEAEEEEEEEAPKKPAKKLAKAPVKKETPAPKKEVKKVVSEKTKKSLKTGSLSSFGQKASSAKESFEFTVTIGDEEKVFTVPGKKPVDGGILPREALISILADSIKEVTGNDCLKKDAELLFNTFESIIFMVTEKWSLNFIGSRFRNIEAEERLYPPLKGEDYTFVPAHRVLKFRRVCEEDTVVPMRIKQGKDGKPLTDKKGNYIFKK